MKTALQPLRRSLTVALAAAVHKRTGAHALAESVDDSALEVIRTLEACANQVAASFLARAVLTAFGIYE